MYNVETYPSTDSPDTNIKAPPHVQIRDTAPRPCGVPAWRLLPFSWAVIWLLLRPWKMMKLPLSSHRGRVGFVIHCES